MTYRYTYSVAADTLNGIANAGKLDFSVRYYDPSFSEALEATTVDGDSIFLDFAAQLPPAEEPIITAIVNAHDGTAIAWPFMIMGTQVAASVNINSQAWIELGGVVTAPAFFGSPQAMFARVTFAATTSGVALEAKVIERAKSGAERDMVTTLWPIPDLSGATDFYSFDTDVIAHGAQREYVIEARKTGAGGNATIRNVSLSILGK